MNLRKFFLNVFIFLMKYKVRLLVESEDREESVEFWRREDKV